MTKITREITLSDGSVHKTEEMNLSYQEIKRLVVEGRTEKFCLVQSLLDYNHKGKQDYSIIFSSDLDGNFWGCRYQVGVEGNFVTDGECVRMVPHTIYRRHDHPTVTCPVR